LFRRNEGGIWCGAKRVRPQHVEIFGTDTSTDTRRRLINVMMSAGL
jgi:hypothetical protein